MWPLNIRLGPPPVALEAPSTFGRPSSTSCQADREAQLLERVAHALGHRLLRAGRARDVDERAGGARRGAASSTCRSVVRRAPVSGQRHRRSGEAPRRRTARSAAHGHRPTARAEAASDRGSHPPTPSSTASRRCEGLGPSASDSTPGYGPPTRATFCGRTPLPYLIKNSRRVQTAREQTRSGRSTCQRSCRSTEGRSYDSGTCLLGRRGLRRDAAREHGLLHASAVISMDEGTCLYLQETWHVRKNGAWPFSDVPVDFLKPAA